MINRFNFTRQESSLFFFATLCSIFLSVFIYYQQSIVNPDAICYLMSAREIGLTGISGAMNLCGQARWPFYSLLIYGFANLFHFSYLTSAHLIDSFFSLLTVLSFILLVRELGGRGRILWLAAFVILISHSLNSVREYIIRDHGFWSFYLLSIILLMRYMKSPSFNRALFVSVSLSLATLFRIEGLIFLTVIPLLTMFYPAHTMKEKIKGVFAFYFLFVCAGLMISIWLIYHSDQTLEKFGRLAEIPYQLHYGFLLMLNRFQEMKMAMVDHVLTSDAAGQSGLILTLIFISWYLILVFSNLSWVYFLLLLYALKTKAMTLSKEAKFVVYSFLSINIFITFAFLIEKHFLSKRYLVALSLLLMLPLPFALNRILTRASQIRFRLSLFVMLILLFITIRNDFTGGDSKAYIEEAGHFIAENIPASSSLYFNDYQLMYYSDRFDKQIFHEYYRQFAERNDIAASNFKQYDFLALRMKKRDQYAYSWANQLLPLKTFSNKKGDKVVIYQIIPKDVYRRNL